MMGWNSLALKKRLSPFMLWSIFLIYVYQKNMVKSRHNKLTYSTIFKEIRFTQHCSCYKSKSLKPLRIKCLAQGHFRRTCAFFSFFIYPYIYTYIYTHSNGGMQLTQVPTYKLKTCLFDLICNSCHLTAAQYSSGLTQYFCLCLTTEFIYESW